MARSGFLLFFICPLLLAACTDGIAPAASPTPATVLATPVQTSTTTETITPQIGTPTEVVGGPTETQGLGSIIYLDVDGVTIRKARPDGSGRESVTVVEKEDGEYVSSLTADPTGQYLIYGLSTERYSFISRYYLFHDGETMPLPGIDLAERPMWSPDGTRIAGQTYRSAIEPGSIYTYELGATQPQVHDFEGRPDWFPDGKRLLVVRDDNLFVVNVENGQSQQLTDLPQEEEGDAWVVQEAHVLPDRQSAIFFGGKFKEGGELMLGASGNGQQWWSVSLSGGEPEPWLEPEGNTIIAFAQDTGKDKIAYVGSSHYNACAGVETIAVVEASVPAGQPDYPSIPALDEAAANFVFVNNLAWSPDGDILAFGVVPYRCPEDAADWLTDTPVIYAWDEKTKETILMLEGQFPVWVK